eukprot:3296458-Pyramimonas_sp.AAC.1
MRNMHYVSRTRDCPIFTLTRCWRHTPPSGRVFVESFVTGNWCDGLELTKRGWACSSFERRVLATGDSLSRLTSSSEQTMYSASFDIKDYFHELRIDEELSQYFALSPVRASAVGVDSIGGVKVGPNELIYPALQTLPM